MPTSTRKYAPFSLELDGMYNIRNFLSEIPQIERIISERSDETPVVDAKL